MQGLTFVTLLLFLRHAFPLPFLKTPEKDVTLEKGPEEAPQEMIRTHRNLYQFHSMIDCATNLSSSYYYDYGCYCGYGGAGMPVDETDLCCQIYDECYGTIMNDPNLCTFPSSVYWKIYTRDDTCTGCADAEGTCGRAICECDGEAARCFGRSEYNPEHFDYPQENCSGS